MCKCASVWRREEKRGEERRREEKRGEERREYLYDGSQALHIGLLSFQQEPHHMVPHLLLQGMGGEGVW